MSAEEILIIVASVVGGLALFLFAMIFTMVIQSSDATIGIVQMSETIKSNYYRRSHGALGRRTSTTVFADICYTQERLIDYCDIVADSLIKYNRAVGGSIDFDPEKMERAKQRVHELFLDKFKMLELAEAEEDRRTELQEKAGDQPCASFYPDLKRRPEAFFFTLDL